MAVKCPKGHWYNPEQTGGGCPKCASQTQAGSSISDDDVLAIMSSPQVGGGVVTEDDEKAEKKDSSGSAIMRRKKICPECSHEASFSFVYCPRCGAPLKLASVKLE